MFWSGNGGNVVVNPSPGVSLNIARWMLRKGSRNVENTHSGVSSTNFEKVVSDHSGSIDIPWDDTNLPDTDAGLVEGAKVTIRFNLGTSGKFQTLANTIIESVEDTDDNSQDIVRTTVNFKGGVLTRPVT